MITPFKETLPRLTWKSRVSYSLHDYNIYFKSLSFQIKKEGHKDPPFLHLLVFRMITTYTTDEFLHFLNNFLVIGFLQKKVDNKEDTVWVNHRVRVNS